MGLLPKDFKSFASADFAILAYLCIIIQFLFNAKDFKSLASAGFAILACCNGVVLRSVPKTVGRECVCADCACGAALTGEIIANRRVDVKRVSGAGG